MKNIDLILNMIEYNLVAPKVLYLKCSTILTQSEIDECFGKWYIVKNESLLVQILNELKNLFK